KGLAHSIRCLPDILREGSVRKIRGAVFVLNRAEKEHLERLGVEASVRLRTMGVDFDEITPLCHEEKAMLRKRLGLPEDSTILTSYVGVFREGFSTMKGAHDMVRIYEELKSALRNNIQLVISGICKRIADEWREKGIAAYEFLPHKTFVDIVRSSDLYFLPASSTYRYGGVGVAIMEALAAGVPVVSPTLVHFPAAEKVKCVGLKTPWVDDEKDLRVFVEKLICAVQNHSQFRRDIIRSISYSYYSWKSFVEELECVTKKWL
nr:glycosyltransferase [Candidatus Njordarchaeum guaymaensis]